MRAQLIALNSTNFWQRGRKPTGRLGIDWTDPVTFGLRHYAVWNEGGGGPFDLVRPDQNFTLHSTVPDWAVTEAGVAGDVGSGSSFICPINVGTWLAADFTFRIIHKPNWAGTFSPITDTSGRKFSLFCDTSGNFDFLTIQGATYAEAGLTLTGFNMASGSIWDLVISNLGGTASYYLNGVLVTTRTPGGSGNTDTSLHFGNNISGGGTHYRGQYILSSAWTRALSAAEVLALYVDRYRGLKQLVPSYQVGIIAAADTLFAQACL